MATINSISLYLARTHTGDCFVGVGLYAPGGGLIGNTALVAYDDIQHTITGPSWITFTFDTPAPISGTGWYVIRLYITPHTNYDMMGLRWYGASDWTEKPAEAPYAGSEHAVVPGTSSTRAYDMSVGGFTANYARTPTADYYTQSDNGITIQSYLEPAGSLAKPTTPTPANASGPGVDFSTWAVSWVDGGTTETYDVFFGTSPYALNRVVEGTALTSHTFALGQRPPIENGTVYWRVDAIADGERVTGDVWSFDPRPAAPAPTSPEHEATGQTLHVGATWSNAAAAQTYELRIAEGEWLLPIVVTGLTGHTVLNLSDYLVLRHARTYYWRVDSRNSFGVTEGPVFSFTTMPFIRAMPSYELLPQVPPQDPPVDPLGPLDGGVVGVDFRWTGGNNMISVRRLVVAANNKLWYEDV